MRRPQESLIMRRKQRSYASHTNTSGTSESAAVCESPFKQGDISTCTVTALMQNYSSLFHFVH